MQADPDPQSPERDEQDEHEEKETIADVAAKLSKLEENVRTYRMLLEAEEKLLYVDVIDELERTRDQITTVREQQQQRFTPWVRPALRPHAGQPPACLRDALADRPCKLGLPVGCL